MPPYHPTRAEQETVIRWDRDDPTVHVWTADPVTWRKMERLGVPVTRETTCQGRRSGRFYTIPLSQFRWRLKRAHAPGRPVPGGPRRPQEPRYPVSSDPSEPLAGVRTGAPA